MLQNDFRTPLITLFLQASLSNSSLVISGSGCAQRLPRWCLSSIRWCVIVCVRRSRELIQSPLRFPAAFSSKVCMLVKNGNIWCDVCRFFQELSYRLFVSDRRPVSAHLPLAWTHSSRRDVKALMSRLENLAMAVKPSDWDITHRTC